VVTLLPTPEAKLSDAGPDYARAGREGSGGDDLTTTVHRHLLPTPTTQDASSVAGPSQLDRNTPPLNAVAHQLLPTPSPFHLANTETPEEWLVRRADVQERTGTRHGPALPVVAISVADGHPLYQGGKGPTLWEPEPAPVVPPEPFAGIQWGPYRECIVRQSTAWGRTPPAPTEVGPKGGRRLSPRFVEWMMGLPDGHVTDVPGLSTNDQLHALGNGVVRQQAAAAIKHLLSRRSSNPEEDQA
jgi:site-specific DNA-cytosine methylase